MIKYKLSVAVGCGVAMLFACEQSEVQTLVPIDDSPIYKSLPVAESGNARLSSGNYAIMMAEYITADGSGEVGRTVYFNNVGNKRLSADFAPGLSLDGTDAVSYYVDQNRPSEDVAVGVSSAAIDRAMSTWDDVTCSELGLTKVPSNPAISTGFVAAFYGFPGSFEYTADLVHSGWMPAAFFDSLAVGGSEFILGVTFTLIFTDDDGNAVDTNNDNRADVAWREIYYNDAFLWKDGATYDIETVALHEAGHGLSQGHFGKAFATGNGKLHFSPRAVMNAAYSGIQTDIAHTDNAGHCTNWANWPNK
jgi:hypothetical protein